MPHVPQSLRVSAMRRGRSEPQGLRSLRGRGLLQQQVPNRSLERRAQEKLRFAKQEQLKQSKGGSSRCCVPAAAHALRGLALLHAPSFATPRGLGVPTPFRPGTQRAVRLFVQQLFAGPRPRVDGP